MTAKIVAALLLALLPATGMARECSKDHANLCEDGYTWDEASQACVAIVSS